MVLSTIIRALTVDVEFPQWIYDSEKPVPGQGGQRKNRNAYADVFGELGCCAQEGPVRPRRECVDGGSQRDGCHDDQ